MLNEDSELFRESFYFILKQQLSLSKRDFMKFFAKVDTLTIFRWIAFIASLLLGVIYFGIIIEKFLNPDRTSGSIVSNLILFGAFSSFLLSTAYALYVALYRHKKNFSP